MSLLDDIRKEQASDGTSMDTKYVRRMEAALLAADGLAKRMGVLKDEAWGYGHLYETAFHAHVHEEIEAALAAYRTAIGDV